MENSIGNSNKISEEETILYIKQGSFDSEY